MLIMLKNSLLLVLMLDYFQTIAMTHVTSNINLKMQNNKKYNGDILEEIRNTTMTKCLERCLANCLCKSFDMCDSEICSLISTAEWNSSKLIPSIQCNYFEFKQKNNQQCDRNSCTSVINCCLTSNPCKNGGICLPPKNNEERFRCKCARNYEGKYCEKFFPKTCKDYLNNGLNQGDGDYILYPKWPECNQTAKIYCVDMGSSTPLEYVTLPAAKNFAVYYKKDMGNRKEQTNFEKIRLNVTSMNVSTEDYRFATKIGSGNFHQLASAGDCVSDSCDGETRIGNFNVNITGTSFCLPQSIPYKFSSHPPCVVKVFFPSMSPDRKRWSGKCGGACGHCKPREIVLDIDGC